MFPPKVETPLRAPPSKLEVKGLSATVCVPRVTAQNKKCFDLACLHGGCGPLEFCAELIVRPELRLLFILPVRAR